MPMQKGMSYSITWKYRQVMIMAQKKDRSRFSIKFRESDPAHERTICILESQGQRNIAPFIVNAVLHYVQCSETPDISCMLAESPKPTIDKNAIEDMIKEILLQEGIIQAKPKKITPVEVYKEERNVEDKVKDIQSESIKVQNTVNDDMRAIIAKTMSAFRSE